VQKIIQSFAKKNRKHSLLIYLIVYMILLDLNEVLFNLDKVEDKMSDVYPKIFSRVDFPDKITLLFRRR